MPIYEYKCSCGKQFETIQSMNDAKLVKCNKKLEGSRYGYWVLCSAAGINFGGFVF